MNKNNFAANLAICVLAFAAPFSCQSNKDNQVYNPPTGEGYYILTPKVSESPRINGASLFGVRPGSPFIYTVAVTGEQPMTIKVEGLPEGLSFDPSNNLISGRIKDTTPKDYTLKFIAENSKGTAERAFTIKVGNDICITPPMGWSSWIATKKTVSQDKVMANVKVFLDKGLKNYGYTYINIDDAWQGVRGGKYNAIMPDSIKFPDMQGLSDYLHKQGLKFGLYSTPWVTSYAGYAGGSSDTEDGYWDKTMIWDKEMRNIEGSCSYFGKHRLDNQDAKQWAEWGIDYMKYDWNPNDSVSIIFTANALRSCGRDIAFSISNSCPEYLGGLCKDHVEVARTNGDLRARWEGKGEHISLRDNWNHHKQWLVNAYNGNEGFIPDPDFLMVGLQKYGSKDSLTADELYHHVSSFILWGGPQLLSCNLAGMTEFEWSLVTNVEMLDINQDALVKPAACVYDKDGIEVLAKQLADGEIAFGIFNFNDQPTEATIDWNTLGISGTKELRDVWRQQNIGTYEKQVKAMIPRHGVVVLRTKTI